jgi:hypothetical protein
MRSRAHLRSQARDTGLGLTAGVAPLPGSAANREPPPASLQRRRLRVGAAAYFSDMFGSPAAFRPVPEIVHVPPFGVPAL